MRVGASILSCGIAINRRRPPAEGVREWANRRPHRNDPRANGSRGRRVRAAVKAGRAAVRAAGAAGLNTRAAAAAGDKADKAVRHNNDGADNQAPACPVKTTLRARMPDRSRSFPGSMNRA